MGNVPRLDGLQCRVPGDFDPPAKKGRKKIAGLKIRYRIRTEVADQTCTMDWEGGTIGAIVPAMMGHGEAGRASPWPFSLR